MPTINQNTTPLANGMCWDINEVENPQGGVGVSQPTLFEYNVIPTTIVVDYVAPLQTVLPATPLNLFAAHETNFLGTQVITFDCLRVPSITIAVGATGVQTILTIVGYDDRNVSVIGDVTIPVATAAGTYTLDTFVAGGGVKAYKKIVSCTFTADPGQQVSIGQGDAIGLPFFVPHEQYIKTLMWGNAVVNQFGGAFVPGYQFNPQTIAPLGNQQFNPLDPRAPTAVTSDARGYVVLPTASNGARMLSVSFYVYGADSYLQWLLTNGNLSAQTQTQITVAAYNSGQMLDRDEVGLQYPGGD